MDYEKETVTKLTEAFVGRKITGVRFMSTKEMADLDWSYRPIIIELEGGGFLFSLADDEGNNGGALATHLGDLPTVGVLR